MDACRLYMFHNTHYYHVFAIADAICLSFFGTVSFTLNAGIVVKVAIFSLLMGVIGGFLPSVRAARMNIVDALRAA